jgi:hypothetical protein
MAQVRQCRGFPLASSLDRCHDYEALSSASRAVTPPSRVTPCITYFLSPPFVRKALYKNGDRWLLTVPMTCMRACVHYSGVDEVVMAVHLQVNPRGPGSFHEPAREHCQITSASHSFCVCLLLVKRPSSEKQPHSFTSGGLFRIATPFRTPGSLH